MEVVLVLAVHFALGALGVYVWLRNHEKYQRGMHVKYPLLSREQVDDITAWGFWGVVYLAVVFLFGIAGLFGVLVASSLSVHVVGEDNWMEANGDLRGW